jgi:hypothetical protein
MLSETRAEELIRETLASQADRAVAGTEVLAGLDPAVSARKRRNRTLGMVAVAAAVVAAVAVPVGLHLGRSPDTPPAAGPWVRTPYQVGWVPSGYLADERSASLDGSRYSQMWAQGQFNSVSFAAETTAKEPSCGSDTEQVSINGLPGQVGMCTTGTLVGQDSGREIWTLQVRWSPEPGWHLTVGMTQEQNPDAIANRDTVLRMARSVVRDPSARLDVALTVLHVPTGVTFNRAIEVYQSPLTPGRWSVQVGAEPDGQLPSYIPNASGSQFTVPYLEVFWGPDVTVTQGQTPAGWCDGEISCTTFVKLGRWWLEVRVQQRMPMLHPNVTLQQATELAHAVTVNPGFDYSWLGH